MSVVFHIFAKTHEKIRKKAPMLSLCQDPKY